MFIIIQLFYKILLKTHKDTLKQLIHVYTLIAAYKS